MATSYNAVVRLPAEGGPGTMLDVAFADKRTSDDWWNMVKQNLDVLGSGIKADECKRTGASDTWFVIPKSSADAVIALQTHEKFASIKDNWAVRGPSSAKKEEDAAASEEPAEAGSLSEQIAKLSEQVAALSKGLEPPGKDMGKNWQEGPNWKGGYESYKLVDQAYKTCLKKKDEGDDRGFSMMFAQEMMELRRRQRG